MFAIRYPSSTTFNIESYYDWGSGGGKVNSAGSLNQVKY